MGRRARITREQVLAEAREEFARKGFAGATLAGIAARLSVSPAALLRHAATKEELFERAMAQAPRGPLPLEFLAQCDGTEDPRKVLERVARTMVPIVERAFGEGVARWMHSRDQPGGAALRLPFDPREAGSPPRRALALIEGYMRRARSAGRLAVRDPRAAAMAFQGAIFAYVSFQKIFRLVEEPVSLSRYLGTLLAIWEDGAVRPPGRSRR